MTGIKNWEGYRIVLASASPRRRELLNQIGIDPEIYPSLLEETTQEKKPDLMVMELSRQKAEEIALSSKGKAMIIGADTVVAIGGEILGKPETPMRAYEMVEKLQGNTHQVYTGVTVLLCEEDRRKHGVTFVERTDVSVYPMTPGEMKEYAQCGEPLDKAGAYGIQGRFASYIKRIEGDYSNVVGLPLGRLCWEIKGLLEDREDD